MLPAERDGKKINPYPAGLAIAADGNTLFVANNLDDSVSLIDLLGRTVKATQPVRHNPYGVLLSTRRAGGDRRGLTRAFLGQLHKSATAQFVRRVVASTQSGGHNNVIDPLERTRLRVGCEFDYESDSPVPMLMLVRAQPDGEHQTLWESRWTEPEVPVREYVDTFGNYCWRFVAPVGRFRIRYDALVGISREPDLVVPDAPLVPVEDLPDETLVFTLPSRYIQSDLLISRAWELFGSTPPTWARVQAVCDWVHSNITYATGSSDPTVTAMDVFERRVGVCRDFALLATAFCRALNIPGRYTFGYFPDIAVEPPDVPMDFHAWFEAYLGGRWYSFDARHNVPRIGRVVIGRGRDAVDTALSTQYGSSRLNAMTVWSDELPTDSGRDDDADELEAAEAEGPWRSSVA